MMSDSTLNALLIVISVIITSLGNIILSWQNGVKQNIKQDIVIAKQEDAILKQEATAEKITEIHISTSSTFNEMKLAVAESAKEIAELKALIGEMTKSKAKIKNQ